MEVFWWNYTPLHTLMAPNQWVWFSISSSRSILAIQNTTNEWPKLLGALAHSLDNFLFAVYQSMMLPPSLWVTSLHNTYLYYSLTAPLDRFPATNLFPILISKALIKAMHISPCVYIHISENSIQVCKLEEGFGNRAEVVESVKYGETWDISFRASSK